MTGDDLDKRVAVQRTLRCFAFFNSDEGQLVLAELERAFGVNHPTFVSFDNGHFCPLRAAIRDGQRQVVLHIKSLANKTHEQDTKTKRRATKA
jgi:hypothetical protein